MLFVILGVSQDDDPFSGTGLLVESHLDHRVEKKRYQKYRSHYIHLGGYTEVVAVAKGDSEAHCLKHPVTREACFLLFGKQHSK